MYVVTTNKGVPRSAALIAEYLSAIRHDPYREGRTMTHMSTTLIEDAFVFSTLAAAEMAAVFVGGIVKPLSQENVYGPDQWWVRELDTVTTQPWATDDQRRAYHVVLRLLKAIPETMKAEDQADAN